MGRCAQAGKVPENHHRLCPGIRIPKFEQNLGQSLKFTLPVSLKWLPHLPSYILFLQNVPPTLPNIILFTFPPKSEACVFDPRQLGFPHWTEYSYVPSSMDKGDLFWSLSPLLTVLWEAWHAQFYLSPLP